MLLVKWEEFNYAHIEELKRRFTYVMRVLFSTSKTGIILQAATSVWEVYSSMLEATVVMMFHWFHVDFGQWGRYDTVQAKRWICYLDSHTRSQKSRRLMDGVQKLLICACLFEQAAEKARKEHKETWGHRFAQN